MTSEHPPIQFKTGYRGILLLHRSKDGAKGDQQRNALKRITASSEEFDATVAEFKAIQQASYPTHRIYSSVNPRNMEKAIREFKRRQLDMDYESEAIKWTFYQDVKNRFFSCMMNPSARDSSYYLIDCDDAAQYAEAINCIPRADIIYDYPTKKGRHLIIRPIDPMLLKETVRLSIKRDDLIYIA